MTTVIYEGNANWLSPSDEYWGGGFPQGQTMADRTESTSTRFVLTNGDGTKTIITGTGIGINIYLGWTSLTSVERVSADESTVYEVMSGFAASYSSTGSDLLSNLYGDLLNGANNTFSISGSGGGEWFLGYNGTNTFNLGAGVNDYIGDGTNTTAVVTAGTWLAGDYFGGIGTLQLENAGVVDLQKISGEQEGYRTFQFVSGTSTVTGLDSIAVTNVVGGGTSDTVIFNETSRGGNFSGVSFSNWNSSDTVIIEGFGGSTVTGPSVNVTYENDSNVTINGGGGTDTIVFTGARSQYQVTQTSSNSLTITDERSGSPNGTDNISNVANYQFTDGTYSFAQVIAPPSSPPPPPPPPPTATADMIMRDGNNGDYEIYVLGGNSILSAAALGQVGLEWKVAGVGAFDATDTSDMILRSSNSGAFEIYDISNNTLTGAAAMGQVGLEWSVSGFGDFSSNAGETDMLMRDSNNGKFEVYDLAHNTITAAAPMGQVGLEWSVAGFGDFSMRANETDMLMRNSNTGAFEIYDISNNQITSAAPMGQVGLEWSVVGFGDFSGNANETDMLMRNNNTGAFEIYDIRGNQITSAAPMGQVGLEWSVVGFGPINGAGASDMLMRNTNTGAFEVYDITNNQLASAASMGQVGPEWQVAGIAADPTLSFSPADVQLAQAMAAYAPGSGPDGGSSQPDLTVQSNTTSPLAALGSLAHQT